MCKNYFTSFLFFMLFFLSSAQKRQEVILYNHDGKIDEKGVLINGKKNGPWEYYENGELSVIKNYKDDVKDGEWLAYEKGKLRTKGIIKNGVSDGLWIFYYDNGNIYECGLMKANNINTGLWKRFSEKGNLILEGNYVDGEEDGVWKSYYENGKIKSIRYYKNGKNIKQFFKYSEDGKVIEYGQYDENGLKTGKWKEKIKYDIFYDNHIEEGFYKFDKKIGLWKISDSMGNIVEIDNYNFQPEKWLKTKYYLDGKVFEKSYYEGYKEHGKYRQFYKSGSIMEKGRYYMGYNVGLWKFYDEKGKIKSKTRHDSVFKVLKKINEVEDINNMDYIEIKRDSIYRKH